MGRDLRGGGDIPSDIRRDYDKYAGKSESELTREMLKMAAQGKATGALTPEAIDDFVRRASPMLTPEQRKRLLELTGMIR